LAEHLVKETQTRRAGRTAAAKLDSENRIEQFENGFRADRLSCHRFLANVFRPAAAQLRLRPGQTVGLLSHAQAKGDL
jgi:hypothetical protein